MSLITDMRRRTLTMPRTPEEYRRVVRSACQRDSVRAGLSLLLLGALLLADYHVTLVLALPVIFYAGLWLLTDSKSTQFRDITGPTYQEVREAYSTCLQMQVQIESLANTITEPDIAQQAHRIATIIEQITDALEDSERLEASLGLLRLVRPADVILTRYARIVRRGLDSPEAQSVVSGHLNKLDRAFDRYWLRLREQALLDLEELDEEIESDLDEIPAEIHDLPPQLPKYIGDRIPPEIARMIDSLTPRQLEILRLLPADLTDQQIGDLLFIGKRTVTSHLTEIYNKIGVHKRAGASAFAVRWGLTAFQPQEA